VIEASAEPSETGLAKLVARLLRFMGAAGRRKLFGLFSLMLLGAFAELVSIGSVVPLLSLLGDNSSAQGIGWIDRIVTRIGGLAGGDRLAAAALLFVVAALIAAAIRLALSWSSQNFTLNLGHELAVGIQVRILQQPYLFHVTNNSSRILASLEKAQILSSGVLLQLVQAASAVVIGAFIIFAVASVNLKAAAVAAAILGASYFLIARFASGRLAHDASILGSAYDRRLKLIQESLGGIRDIIIDQSQPVHLEEFRATDRQFARARLSSGFLVTAPRFLIEAAGMVLLAGLAVVLSSEGRGAAALPVLGALALGALRLLPLVQQLYQAWVSLAANRKIAGAVLSLLALPVPDEKPTPSPLPFDRSIRVENLSFIYPGRGAPALEKVSLTIPQGSRVAIVGRTGSGKSTLIDLLMGLLPPTAGSIWVDDIRLGEDAAFMGLADVAGSCRFRVGRSQTMLGSMRKLTALAVGISLLSVTTGAVAAAPVAAPAPVASTASVSPWVALGAMNSPTAAAAATAAAAQDYRDDRGPGFPPIPVLIIILATLGVGIWIITQDDDDGDVDFDVPPPVSPF